MTSAEAILQKAAADGSLDSAAWPKTLQYILDRLDEIVSEFPRLPADSNSNPTAPAVTDLPSRPGTSNANASQESHSTDKENAPPATPSRPPVPAFSAPSESRDVPQEITTFYSSIRTTLSKNFAKDPPHTVQRLAELVLEPKRRYRYLPPYLRALDRVVSVSSPLTIFPLPQAILPTAGGLLNGASSTTQSSTLGSDESLGGALLTPIPWLQNRGQNELISESTEMVEGPNGAGRIETVTVGMFGGGQAPESRNSSVAQIASSHPDGETLPSTGPVTQGELLRQEQEAGIVLNNPHSMTTSPTGTSFGEMEGGGTIMETVEGEEEAPHARGPEIIGMEDTGPQKQGKLDIEGAIGRPSVDHKSPAPETKDAEMKEGAEKSAEETKAAIKDNQGDAKKEGETKEGQDVDMKSDD